MIAPDTLIVITKSAPHTDYTPLFSGIAASALVAAMALYSTRTQRRIAERTMIAQRELSDAATAAQREIAKQGIDAQLETARRGRVVESRREWMRDLREAVAHFEAKATSFHTVSESVAATGPMKADHVAEINRLMTVIVLLMDGRKPEHQAVISAVNGVAGWSEVGTGPLPKSRPDESILVRHARKFASMEAAIMGLDGAVLVLLEAAWEKIRRGE